MSNNASGLPPRQGRGRRVAARDRHGHLELVTEGWIAELADLGVLRQRTSRRADGPFALVVRIVDRDPRRPLPSSLPERGIVHRLDEAPRPNRRTRTDG